MNKIIQIILSISVLLILISGCLESKEEYHSLKYNQTITLYPDNTFTVIGQHGSSSGTYKIESSYVIMTYTPFGNVDRMWRNLSALTDPKDGDTWEVVR